MGARAHLVQLQPYAARPHDCLHKVPERRVRWSRVAGWVYSKNQFMAARSTKRHTKQRTRAGTKSKSASRRARAVVLLYVARVVRRGALERQSIIITNRENHLSRAHTMMRSIRGKQRGCLAVCNQWRISLSLRLSVCCGGAVS